MNAIKEFFVKVCRFIDAFYNFSTKIGAIVYDNPQFDKFAGYVSYLNPVAMLPQLVSTFISTPKELMGVSVLMLGTFILLQTTFMLIFLKGRNKSLFIAMALLVLETIIIVTFTLLRRSPD